jgi:N-acyl-D-aspartate/D-glutamate deacylase
MYPRLAARAAALGIVVASQPGFMSTLGDGFAAAFGDRRDDLYAFASWRRAGITVAGSSDAPVITADPLLGIRDAILRRTGDGVVLGPAERLPARDALDLYTTQAAFAMHREGEIGSLEPGKRADFVVLDRNPLRTDPERITDIRVLATVLGGTPVYQSESIFAGLQRLKYWGLSSLSEGEVMIMYSSGRYLSRSVHDHEIARGTDLESSIPVVRGRGRVQGLPPVIGRSDG